MTNEKFILYSLLSISFVILNLIGGIISGIWLAILGDWGSIGYGMLAMVISSFLLGFALTPVTVFAAAAEYFAQKEIKALSYGFVLLCNLYIVSVVTMWCGGVFYFLATRTTEHSIIPVLIWSYGVALGPWQWITRKDIRSGAGPTSTITTIYAQIGYVVVILMALLGKIISLITLITFLFIMVLGLLHNLVLKIRTGRETTGLVSLASD